MNELLNRTMQRIHMKYSHEQYSYEVFIANAIILN